MGRRLFLWVLRCLCSFHSFFPAGPALSSSQPMCLRGLYVLAGVGVSVPNGVRRRVALDGDGPLVQCDGRRARAADPAPCRLVPQDVARLIVERSTIMSHLFSKRSCSAESDAVLAALLSIFSRYVQRMRKSKEGEEVYSWVRGRGPAQPRPAPRPASAAHPLPLLQSESQDQVFLRWSSGETATMHILVVHAMVILLTLGPPRGEQAAGGSPVEADAPLGEHVHLLLAGPLRSRRCPVVLRCTWVLLTSGPPPPPAGFLEVEMSTWLPTKGLQGPRAPSPRSPPQAWAWPLTCRPGAVSRAGRSSGRLKPPGLAASVSLL